MHHWSGGSCWAGWKQRTYCTAYRIAAWGHLWGLWKQHPQKLWVALCLISLDLAVIGAARFTAYRLKCQGEGRKIGFGHSKLEFLQKCPFTLKQERVLKKHQSVKQHKVLVPTREDWCIPGKVNDPNVYIWFTDRSGINNCFATKCSWAKG